MNTHLAVSAVSCVQALDVAHRDASRINREPNKFQITVVLADDGWHIDFYLKDPDLCGGGPHYIINAETGSITWKRNDR
jgi:hypothetical protein